MVSPLCTQTLEGIQELVLFHATFVLNFSILNLTFSIVALVGNLLVISALWKASSVPSTLRKLFINLAFSDLVVGLIPQLTFGIINATMLKMVASENHNFDVFCPIIFTFYHFSAFLLASASFFTIITLALDRFLSIYLHLRYHELVTSNRVTAVLAVLWLTSGLCATVFITILRYAFVTVAVEVFGLLVSTAIFIYLSRVVKYHQNMIPKQCELEKGGAMEKLREKKSFVNASVVYVVFLVCYVPNLCCAIALMNDEFRLSYRVANHVSLFLVFLNSSLNPLVYCWRYKEIRKHLKRTLKKILRINSTI